MISCSLARHHGKRLYGVISVTLHWRWFGHLEKNDRGCREIRSKEEREAAQGSDFCHLHPNTGDTCLKPRLRAVLDGPVSANGAEQVYWCSCTKRGGAAGLVKESSTCISCAGAALAWEL